MNKLDYRNNSILFLIKLFHFLLSVVLFYCAWLMFRYRELPLIRYSSFRYDYLVLGGYAAVLLFFNRTYNSFLLGYSRVRTLVFSQFLSQFFSMLMVYIAVSLGWNRARDPIYFFVLIVVYIAMDVLWTIFANGYYYRLFKPKKTLLIYRNLRDKRRIGALTGKPVEKLYRIEKEIQFDGTFEEIKSELKEFDAIFVAGVNSHCRNGVLKYCEEKDIRGFFLPHVGDVIMQGAQHIQSFDSPVLMVQRKILKPEYRVSKRAFDIIAAFCGMIILSPVFLITAIAIKAYDHGPVFYKQVRLTKDEKQFSIIKFRSMRIDAEKDGIARLSTGETDDRITPVGRVIRKCRVDELPQLWNVFVGEMSFVGPRPERPEIAEKYYEKIPNFKLRLQVKAGLTGYAQVYGKYNTDPYEKLEFDLLYIKDMSILTDIRLIFATVGILFGSNSTSGIEKGLTALDYEDE